MLIGLNGYDLAALALVSEAGSLEAVANSLFLYVRYRLLGRTAFAAVFMLTGNCQLVYEAEPFVCSGHLAS